MTSAFAAGNLMNDEEDMANDACVWLVNMISNLMNDEDDMVNDVCVWLV